MFNDKYENKIYLVNAKVGAGRLPSAWQLALTDFINSERTATKSG